LFFIYNLIKRMIYIRKLLIFAVLALVFLLYLAASAEQGSSQAWDEFGIPVFRNYTSREYRAHFQNWAIIQDKQGLILVANNDGLLEYDGVNWRRYDLEGKLFHSLRSLGIDNSGTVYCGTGSHFGYLMPDSRGRLKFNSLLDSVAEKYRDFNDVWYTLVLN
jgi:hypothetical protein